MQMLARLPDEEVKSLHPAHTAETVRACLPRLHYFEEGMCAVHHMFGGAVCSAVREAYGDAYLTAHFEVPGEMFTLAMEAKSRGMGVVGSTQNILDFITAKIDEAKERGFAETLVRAPCTTPPSHRHMAVLLLTLTRPAPDIALLLLTLTRPAPDVACSRDAEVRARDRDGHGDVHSAPRPGAAPRRAQPGHPG